jgi:mono/diheme cytochrome c family protein
MKTFFKVVGGVLLAVVALALGAVTWLTVRNPASRPASAAKIEATPARVARGEYLVQHVADCLGCHSDHVDKFGFPVKPGSEGQGGFVFDKTLGFPGVVAAQNITPDKETGLGNWTDGEIVRAIREGVDRNGAALFPMMPYVHFSKMSDDDAQSIVAYLRTLKPIHNRVPDKHIDFPVSLFVKFTPQPLEGPVSAPDPARDHLGYGKYLVTIGGCYECHTPHDDKNQLVADKALSGGWEMRGPWGRVVTANLTPHPDTFIGKATRDEFIGRFRAFAGFDLATAPACPKGSNTIMPWIAFSRMKDDDLGAIYDYLKSVKPVENHVNTFPDRKS